MAQISDRGRGLRLRTLFPQGHFLGGDDIVVRSVSHDPTGCRPGDLFVALCDAERDTHEDVQQAVTRGASAVLAERLLPVGIPQCLVDDTREGYGRLCMELAGRPDRELTTIGITGTHGKTTTSMLVTSVLEAAGQQTGLLNSLGYSDSQTHKKARTNGPGQAELAHWLRRMAMRGCGQAIVELSSASLAQRHVSGTEFDAAIFTNLRAAHLDLHGNVTNYHRAKLRLLDQLKADGFVIANADDYTLRKLMRRHDGPVLTYGMHAEAELTGQLIERHRSEQTFLLHAGPETYPVRTRIIGKQHVSNCLAAAALGMLLGIDLPTIVRGLEQVEHIPGRLERLECGQPFGVFLDTADTPDTLTAALQAVRPVTEGRLICVYGASAGLPAEFRPQLGRAVERGADLGIITDCGAYEEPLEVAHQLIDGYDRPARAHVLPSRRRAITWALSQAQSGDTVVIANYRPAARNNECTLVRQWLEAHPTAGEVEPVRRILPLASVN